MDEKIQQRIETLRKELEVGQQQMQVLEQKIAQLRDTMLRISGAIQVLEEIQSQSTPDPTTGTGTHHG
jgi:prefoldin subunit 5